MSSISPILACSSMHIGPWFVVLLFTMVGLWLVSLALAIANPFLIWVFNVNATSKAGVRKKLCQEEKLMMKNETQK